MEGLVDGLNRLAEGAETARVMDPVRAAYRALDAATSLKLGGGDAASPPAPRWLLELLLAEPAPKQAK
jgi:hypothetical protein